MKKHLNTYNLFLSVILFLLVMLLSSCKTRFTVAYAVETKSKTYYCNHPQFINDTIRGAELKRNGEIRQVFEIPYDSVQSVTFDGVKHIWKP